LNRRPEQSSAFATAHLLWPKTPDRRGRGLSIRTLPHSLRLSRQPISCSATMRSSVRSAEPSHPSRLARCAHSRIRMTPLEARSLCWLRSQDEGVLRISARLLNMRASGWLYRQELGVFLVPGMLAHTEGTELACEWTGTPNELSRIGFHSHEHIVAGQPAPRDDLGHLILHPVPPNVGRMQRR
jgi:hypothetical protein